MIATALVAAIGDAKAFTSGRHLAAWLGLVPRQHSSGGKERLLGISKRGDGYLRRQLMHGARALVAVSHGPRGRLWAWVNGLLGRRPFNVVVAAVANKLARILWALLSRGETYRARRREPGRDVNGVRRALDRPRRGLGGRSSPERLPRAAGATVEDGMNGRTGIGGTRRLAKGEQPAL